MFVPGLRATVPRLRARAPDVAEEEGPRQRGHPLPHGPRRPPRIRLPRPHLRNPLTLRHGVRQQRPMKHHQARITPEFTLDQHDF